MSKQSTWNKRISALAQRLVPCGWALLAIAAAFASGGRAGAQPPIGTVTLPVPDNSANAFQTSLRYDASGNLYAWDGLTVWEQTGGTGSFQSIGAVTAGNQADAGPISFSQDGQTLLLSNGAGGNYNTGNGGFWTMPISGVTATQVSATVPYAYDALAVPAASAIPGSSTKYIVYAGNSSFNGGTVSILDTANGATASPVIQNGPGATTAIAINPQDGSLYLGAFSLTTYTTNIYRFTIGQIDTAYNTQTPLDFLTAGALFTQQGTGSQSGGGLFFDNNGYLFSGGDGLTVFNPGGAVVYDGPLPGGYAWLTYDAARNAVLEVPYGSSTGTLYNTGDFEPALWTNGQGGSWNSTANWSGRPFTTVAALTFAGSTSGTAVVTLDGDQSAAGLQFGDSSAASSYAITAGTGDTLTLGTTANGASIAVESGTQSIAAPVVLAGDLAVSGSGGTLLNLSGDIGQQAGVSAALTLSGGDLVLSGSNSFSGGVAVLGGTLEMPHPYDLPDGSPLTVGNSTAFSGVVTGAADSPRGAAAVPEPGCLAIAIAAGVGGFVLRRRFRLVAQRRIA
jgi:autotransporter-associated beta strand protein